MSASGDPKNPMNEPPAGGYGKGRPSAFGPQEAALPPSPGPLRRFLGFALPGAMAVAVLGSLVLLAVHDLHRRVGTSKQAEVKNSIGQMAKDAVVAYEGQDMSRAATAERRLCASATRAVPADVSSIRGKKYQSSQGDWEVDKGRDAGFACLRFEITSPQYYQYRYEATAESFVAGGRGDLNGDGRLSDFRLQGRVEGGLLLVDPHILETDPEE